MSEPLSPWNLEGFAWGAFRLRDQSRLRLPDPVGLILFSSTCSYAPVASYLGGILKLLDKRHGPQKRLRLGTFSDEIVHPSRNRIFQSFETTCHVLLDELF